MKFDVEKDQGVKIVTIREPSLDNSNCDDFYDMIDKVMDKAKKIILDLQELDFIDSSGLSGIAHIIHRSEESDIKFCVCSAGEMVRNAFDLAHVDRLLKVYDTREDAMAFFRRKRFR